MDAPSAVATDTSRPSGELHETWPGLSLSELSHDRFNGPSTLAPDPRPAA